MSILSSNDSIELYDRTYSPTPESTTSCSDDEGQIIVSSEGQYSSQECFEGPEKTMEVCFQPGIGHEQGLRALTRQQLDFLCTEAKCSILSKISSNYMDAYVLSESSLFVYKYRYIMKTCGTTTLLHCLDSLLKFADDLNMEVRWVGYSRKNLNNPSAQKWPHSNFGDEIKFLDSHSKLQERLNGSGHILGPVTGDHWFVYVADLPHSTALVKPLTPPATKSVAVFPPKAPEMGILQHPSSPPSPSLPDATSSMEGVTINMMMFDMDRAVASMFYKSGSADTGKDMTLAAGINQLVPGATIDACAFTPCGYSMNAILHDAYSTIHVTPEPQCSYASFETNTSLPSYTPLVRNVLHCFRPKRFVLTMFADESALKTLIEAPASLRRILVPRAGTYVRTSVSSTTVEADLSCTMACFSLEETLANAPTAVNSRRSRGLTE